MSVLLSSALSSSTMSILLPIPSSSLSSTKPLPKLHLSGAGGIFPAIECSSRPQKKATAHHRKTRPRKSAPWDIRRGPAVYRPLPLLPPDWSYAANADEGSANVAASLEGSGAAPVLDV